MGDISTGLVVAALLAASLIPAAIAQDPQTAARDVVLVANSKAGTVQLVDADTFQVERAVDVVPGGKVDPSDPSLERDPAETVNAAFVNEFAGDNYAQDLDLSPDGTTLFVSRGHLADVAAFDLTTTPAEMLWNTSVDGFRADHMTISSDGERLFVSDLTEYQVIGLDSSTGEREGTVPTGQYAHGVNVVTPAPAPDTASSENEVSPDGRCVFAEANEPARECLYVGSIGDITLFPREWRADQPDELDPVLGEPYELTIADADSLEVLRTIEFPDGIRPAAFDLSGEDKLMYYQESEFHGIVEYDLEQARELRRVQLPADADASEEDYAFEAPHHGLALSPDGGTLCAAGRASDYAALVDTDTLLPDEIIDVGDAPGWAVTGPDGETCWISNHGSEAEDDQPPADTLTVVSYTDQATVATIPTDDGPKHLLAASVPGSVL